MSSIPPNTRWLLLALLMTTSRLEAQNYQLFKTLRAHQSAVSHLTFRAEDNLLVSGDKQGHIALWETSRHTLVKKWKAHEGKVTDINFSPDGKQMVSAGYDGKICVWDLSNHQKVTDFENPAIAPYANVSGKEPTFAFFINEDLVCFGGYNQQVNTGSIDLGDVEKIYQGSAAITCGVLSPQGNKVALGEAGKVVLLNLQNNEVIHRLGGSTELKDFVCEVRFVPNSSTLAYWAYNGKVHFYDLSARRSPKLAFSMAASPKSGTSNLAFSEDHKLLITGNEDNKTKVWQWQNKQARLRQTLGKHQSAVTCFALSPAGEYLVTGSNDHTVRVWKNNRMRTRQASPEVPSSFEGRTVETQHRFFVKKKRFSIYVWDNRVIDNDIISVNVNGRWVLQNFTLKRRKKKINIDLSQKHNYLLIKAHNEGRIPPNTTAVMIDTGNTPKTVLLKSTRHSSAAIHFVYTGER